MTGILMLESLTRGNTLKQGDKTPLTYKLLDADGDNLSIEGKTATVRLMYPNYLTIGYEKTGLTVQTDDTVTFTIDSVIPARKYHVEIIVDNKFVFPSRSVESKFTIDKSSLGTETNIIEIIGKDILINAVKSQVDTDLQPLVASMESAQQAEMQRASEESSRASAESKRVQAEIERDSKIEEIERVAIEPPKPIHTLKVENEVFSSDEVSVSEGVITINNHNLKAGDKVAFVATATAYNVFEPFEGSMRLNTVYYIVNLSNDSFQISTTQNGEPIVFTIDTKGFLWQFEKVSVNSLQVRRLEGTKYRVVFTGAHEGNNSTRRLLNAYTNPGNVSTRYDSVDLQNTITATNISPVHGVMDIYSEMIFKVINRKILITVDSSFTIIDESRSSHSEETYRNRILTRTTNPTVGFQDSIKLIGVGGRHLFDGSTLEVYEA